MDTRRTKSQGRFDRSINGLSAVPFESFFQLDANTRTRGHSVKLKKKSFHAELRHSERVINLWNSLDEETVTASSVRH